MAYLRKVKGGWRAEIERAGVRTSATRETKAAAQAWAAAEETALTSGAHEQFPARTLTEAFRRYEKEVSKHKRGARAEMLRFTAFERMFPDTAGKLLDTITTADLGVWRDARRKQVADSSVVREAAQLRNVWSVAAHEWKWTADPSPWRSLKLPRKALARTRRTGWAELRLVLRHLGYRPGGARDAPAGGCLCLSGGPPYGDACRAGDGLARSNVDLQRRVATLEVHKTVEVGRRHVPLFGRASY